MLLNEISYIELLCATIYLTLPESDWIMPGGTERELMSKKSNRTWNASDSVLALYFMPMVLIIRMFQ